MVRTKREVTRPQKNLRKKKAPTKKNVKVGCPSGADSGMPRTSLICNEYTPRPVASGL